MPDACCSGMRRSYERLSNMAKRAKTNPVERSEVADRHTGAGAGTAACRSPEKVDPRVPFPTTVETDGREQPRPDQITWYQLAALVKQDPQAAYQRWAEIAHAARQELDSGQRAAAAGQLLDTPWEQAQFLAIRQSLAEEWQPTRGLEDRLIDMMAHTFEGWLFWMQRSTTRAIFQAQVETRSLGEIGKWQTPTVSDVVAMEQAMAIAERFNRIFLRTLRALRDLRRYSPTVTIQSAAQVNIGAQQVNAALSEGPLGGATHGGEGAQPQVSGDCISAE